MYIQIENKILIMYGIQVNSDQVWPGLNLWEDLSLKIPDWYARI